jgi:hypothetical protein
MIMPVLEEAAGPLTPAALTQNFRFNGARDGFLGLNLNTKPDGYVGIEVRPGLNRGGEIYFKQRY